MKKLLVLALVFCMVFSFACAKDNNPDNESQNDINTPVDNQDPDSEDENEPDSGEENNPDEYIEYTYLELSKTPEYKKDENVLILYFTDFVIWQNVSEKCIVGYIDDDGANSIPAYAVYDLYPELVIDSDVYCGVALRLDTALPAGTYPFSVVFGDFMINFLHTID